MLLPHLVVNVLLHNMWLVHSQLGCSFFQTWPRSRIGIHPPSVMVSLPVSASLIY